MLFSLVTCSGCTGIAYLFGDLETFHTSHDVLNLIVVFSLARLLILLVVIRLSVSKINLSEKKKLALQNHLHFGSEKRRMMYVTYNIYIYT